MQKPANQYKLKPSPKPIKDNGELKKPLTKEISSKKTSPTLVEFKNQNAQVPEWRLQLQNAVQKRMKRAGDPSENASEPRMTAVGSAAAVAPAREAAEDASVKKQIDNKFLSKALDRIEASRSRYHIEEEIPPPSQKSPAAEKAKKKEYPFSIAAKTSPDEIEAEALSPKPAETAAKPTLVEEPEARDSKPVKGFYDTSELNPEFEPARLSSSLGKIHVAAQPQPETTPEKEVSEALVEVSEEEDTDSKAEEYDDFAPFSVRFNAAFFDIILGGFLSFALLVPFVFAGSDWFSAAGLGAFFVTSAIVLFIYQTVSIGLVGKTFGMHLFSIEMIDIEGENYPTFHQAAVSSSVYLLSLGCLGLGFVTALFDDDRRTVHDLASGTLVVKEL